MVWLCRSRHIGTKRVVRQIWKISSFVSKQHCPKSGDSREYEKLFEANQSNLAPRPKKASRSTFCKENLAICPAVRMVPYSSVPHHQKSSPGLFTKSQRIGAKGMLIQTKPCSQKCSSCWVIVHMVN